jgi:NADH:ubiquinone oxidoreductase subunit F (NADH-binding)
MSGMCLRSDQIADYTIHHYAGLVIHRLDKDERQLILSWLQFFRSESCGQCVPCREGTYHLYDMYVKGGYDEEIFRDIIFTMENSSFCTLGKMAVTALMTYYENIKRKKIGESESNKKCV